MLVLSETGLWKRGHSDLSRTRPRPGRRPAPHGILEATSDPQAPRQRSPCCEHAFVQRWHVQHVGLCVTLPWARSEPQDARGPAGGGPISLPEAPEGRDTWRRAPSTPRPAPPGGRALRTGWPTFCVPGASLDRAETITVAAMSSSSSSTRTRLKLICGREHAPETPAPPAPGPRPQPRCPRDARPLSALGVLTYF